MSVLDSGPETVTVYPAVEVVDEYGQAVRVPDLTRPVTVTDVHLHPVASAESADLGQVATARYRLIARAAPVGPWARVDWRGRSYDVVGEPATWHAPDHLAHVSALIQAGGT
ncbi:MULTISPECIES: hypothetical protein [unclassified Crossiella]|uniref:hypothetical protein n=1 Tax=unclassified Crossiella TaxID=2620835 RepID=UPI001FFF7F44|nr:MULTISPECIES: hypothetical protein [unclassified Crossiella]MCK2237711.1 hypothetical protein [Crossiella sp. S99.2]MCK2254997.1 hypothetical protein [Crossiella sp. S99.1]